MLFEWDINDQTNLLRIDKLFTVFFFCLGDKEMFILLKGSTETSLPVKRSIIQQFDAVMKAHDQLISSILGY